MTIHTPCHGLPNEDHGSNLVLVFDVVVLGHNCEDFEQFR